MARKPQAPTKKQIAARRALLESPEKRSGFRDVLALLPEGDEALMAHAAFRLEQYNDARQCGDAQSMETAELFYWAVVWQLNGGSVFGCKAPGGGLDRLQAHLAAEPGVPPLWGQLGEWLLEVGEMRLWVKNGCSTLGGGHGVDLRAVDADAPFLSDHGLLNVRLWPDEYPGMDFVRALRAKVENLLATDHPPVAIGDEHQPGLVPEWLAPALEGVTDNGQQALALSGRPSVDLPQVLPEPKPPMSNSERQKAFRRRKKEAREAGKKDGVQTLALTSAERRVLSLGLLAHEDLERRDDNWEAAKKPEFDALLRKLWPENAGLDYLAEPKRSTCRPAEFLRAELAGQRVLIQRLEDENRRLRVALGEIAAELIDAPVPPVPPAPRARQCVGAPPLESIDALGGVVDFELVSVGAPQALALVEDQVEHRLFESPAAHEVVRLADKVSRHIRVGGWMTPATARARIAEWKAQTLLQATLRGNPNAGKVVLSLFDHTGNWSRPWEEAGYAVVCFDIQDNPELGDVNAFDVEFFTDYFADFDGLEVYAILAACPCTEFATSGARHFAAKDADGRTDAAVQLVEQTKRVIEYYRPTIWSIENPVGRIEKLGGLPAWRLSFDPHHLGDPYTKKTLIWGRFNANLPIAPVEPVEGSKMHTKFGGSSQATKNGRSETPEGFAYAFFLANNAIDNPQLAVTCKYDRLSPQLLRSVVERGFSIEQIGAAISDAYYFELDDEAAESILRGMLSAG